MCCCCSRIARALSSPMPRFALQIKADLTNVQEIQWDRSHQWCIDWQQAGSSERRDGVYISADEEHELSGSRGTANLAIKFDKHDKHEASARLEQAPESRACKAVYRGEDSGQWVPILVVECRGMEPVKWTPGGGFKVVSAGDSGKVFEDVDLSEDWCEYDEDSDLSLEIMGLESRWETVR